MTPVVLDVLDRLGAHFGLDSLRIGRPAAFEVAARAALAVTTPAVVVEIVADLGPLGGVRQPWGVVLHRLRRVPELVATRQRAQEDRTEAARWASLDRAARRGETLRALVERGVLFVDEAETMARREFPDPDQASVALAAVTRGER